MLSHQVDVLPFPGKVQEDGAAQFNEQRADYNGGDEGDHGPQVAFVQQVRQQHAVTQGKALARHHGHEVGERHDAEAADLDQGKREHFPQRSPYSGRKPAPP